MGRFLDEPVVSQPVRRGRFLDESPSETIAPQKPIFLEKTLNNVVPGGPITTGIAKGVADAYGGAREGVSSAVSRLMPDGGMRVKTSIPNFLAPQVPMLNIPTGERTARESTKELAGIGFDEAVTAGLFHAVPAFLRTADTLNDVRRAGTFNLSPENLTSKAQKLTTEILQPPKGYLQNYIERGKISPAVEKGMYAIKKSKDYRQLGEGIDETIKSTFNKKNQILKENNFDIGRKYLDELQSLISETKASGQSTPEEISQMQDVLDREVKYLNDLSPNGLDRLAGQKRKEYLQDLTDKLLQKTERGDIIDTQPARNRALDALRRGLRRTVHGGDQEVINIDSTYGGLLDAKKFAAGEEALVNRQIPPGMLERIPGIRTILNPRESIGEAISSAAVRRSKSLPRKTGQVESILQILKKRKPL